MVPSHFIQGTTCPRIPLSSYDGRLSRFKVQGVCSQEVYWIRILDVGMLVHTKNVHMTLVVHFKQGLKASCTPLREQEAFKTIEH